MRDILQLTGIAVMAGSVFTVIPIALLVGLWWSLLAGPPAAAAVCWLGGQIYLAG